MKIIDKIMDAMNLYDEVDEDFDEELEVKKPLPKEEPVAKPERQSLFRKKELTPTSVKPKESPATGVTEKESTPKKPTLSFKAPFKKENKQDAPVSEPKQAGGKMGSRTLNLPVANKLINVVVLEPTSFDDSQKVADYLRGSEPVVVNFKGTDNVVAKRMTDFISGTIYALGGSMKKLGRDILICAPKNVDIDAGEEMYDERGEQPWKK